MDNNAQPLVRQLFDIYHYIYTVNGLAYSEISALLSEIGDGLDYGVLTNGLEVLTNTGLIKKDEVGYSASRIAPKMNDFKISLETGLGLNESKLLNETFEIEGIKAISPEGYVEYWKAYVPPESKYLLPYLEGLGIIDFVEGGRIIILQRDSVAAKFLLDAIRKSSKRRKSLEDLLKDLEEKRKIGAIAENIALSFERKRLVSLGRNDLPELISNDYVNAGYDLLSYEDSKSLSFDRFIEVKAVGPDGRFFLSRNELNQAKQKSKSFFIYLIDVTRSIPGNPVIEVINDPSNILFDKQSDWLSTIESYRFERLGEASDLVQEVPNNRDTVL